MYNLASDSAFMDIKGSLRSRMEQILKEQEDPRMFGKGNIFNTYGYSNNQGWNYYERFMAGEFSMEHTNWVNPEDCEEKPLE